MAGNTDRSAAAHRDHSVALWLVATLPGKPVKVASPLFPPAAWPTYFGQVDWTQQFAWSAASLAPTDPDSLGRRSGRTTALGVHSAD